MNCRSPYLGDLHCTAWRESIAREKVGGGAVGEFTREGWEAGDERDR